MPLAILYALGALVSYGITDFIYKRAAVAGVRADHFLVGQAWCFFPAVVAYAVLTRNLVPVGPAAWGMLAGLFVFVAFYYFARSLRGGAVSTNASIFRLNFIVTAVLAIAVLGEPLTPAKLGGLGCALVATWLLVGGAAGKSKDVPGRRSLVEVAIATLAFGASNFFHTVGLRHGVLPETMAVAQAIVFMPLATATVVIVDRRLPPPPPTFRYGGAAATVLLAATVLMLRSVALGQASVLVPIAQMGFIVAALLGVGLLGEPLTARKTAGVAFAAAALAILAAS